jgi:amino acid transporter
LPLLVLYGLGVTIGAGIYVLLGTTAARAGMQAPFAFVLASLVMAPTACSFAEMAGRHPVSAGEAAYVRAGFGSETLTLATGLLVVLAGLVSSATISIGAAGYVSAFLELPIPALVPPIVLLMGLVAAWGILESVLMAAVFTLIETSGLLAIIFFGFTSDAETLARFPEIFVLPSLSVFTGILSAALLAFFAFIGFEDLVNVAEETKSPEKSMPRAIFLTLLLTTVIYFLVAWVAVITVPPAELGASNAPLGLVYARTTGASHALLSAIAIVATLNTIIIQMIMASRVLYGMAKQGNLPAFLGYVNGRTRTPLNGTALAVVLVLVMALAFPLEGLAEWTSRITLVVFSLVNLALLRIKAAGKSAPPGVFIAPRWVPLLGLLLSLGLLFGDFLEF